MPWVTNIWLSPTGKVTTDAGGHKRTNWLSGESQNETWKKTSDSRFFEKLKKNYSNKKPIRCKNVFYSVLFMLKRVWFCWYSGMPSGIDTHWCGNSREPVYFSYKIKFWITVYDIERAGKRNFDDRCC